MRERLLSPSALPFTLALQGLAFALVAFFVPLETDTTAREGTSASGDPHAAPTASAGGFQIPRDLEPRQLPLPRLPDLDRPLRDETPAPEEDGSQRSPDPEPRAPALASLRVSSVALASLVPISVAAPLPGAPDSLEPHSIDGRSWLTGTRPARRGPGGATGPSDIGTGDGGWGGSGIGGTGGGSGGYCPTPTGIGGGGRGGRGRPGGTTPGPSGVSSGGGEGSGSGGAPAGSGGGRPTKGGKGRGPAKGKAK